MRQSNGQTNLTVTALFVEWLTLSIKSEIKAILKENNKIFSIERFANHCSKNCKKKHIHHCVQQYFMICSSD